VGKHSLQGEDCRCSRRSDQGMLPIGPVSSSSSGDGPDPGCNTDLIDERSRNDCNSTGSIKADQHSHSSSANLDTGLEPNPKDCPGSSSGHDCGGSSWPCTNASACESSSKSPCDSSEQFHHQGYDENDASEECRSTQLQQEGLAWAARHCLCNVMTSSIDIAELLGSLLENHVSWEDAAMYFASPDDARTGLMKHTKGPRAAEEEKVGLCSSSTAAERGHLTLAVCQMCAELVSKQPRHYGLMRKASRRALAFQLALRYQQFTYPGGSKYLVACGAQSAEVVQHAVESLGSAVQEHGIVQVLQTLAVARQLPGWSAPSAGAKEEAIWFWDCCLNATIVGHRHAAGNILHLKGSVGAMRMACAMAIERVLPGVMNQLESGALSSSAVHQHAAVAEKLTPWQGRQCSDLETYEAALQCKSILMATLQVSFCCCNPDCTSLQGVSELGLVFKAEGSCTSSSSSSNSQKGCRPIGGGVCSGCSVSCYCSRKCQRQHWAAGHKNVCRELVC
jgi:hypothetical protein